MDGRMRRFLLFFLLFFFFYDYFICFLLMLLLLSLLLVRLNTARVLNKFMENQCEKIERLLELHDSYHHRVEKFYAKEDERRQAQAARDEELFVKEVSSSLH